MVFNLLSKQPFARTYLVKGMLNVSIYILLAFIITTAADDNGMRVVYSKRLISSAWMFKKSVITLSMYAWIYALYGLDGVLYCKISLQQLRKNCETLLKSSLLQWLQTSKTIPLELL